MDVMGYAANQAADNEKACSERIAHTMKVGTAAMMAVVTVLGVAVAAAQAVMVML